MVPANESELLEHLTVGVLIVDARGNEVLQTTRAQVLLQSSLLASPERRSRRLSSLAQRCQEKSRALSSPFWTIDSCRLLDKRTWMMASVSSLSFVG